MDSEDGLWEEVQQRRWGRGAGAEEAADSETESEFKSSSSAASESSEYKEIPREPETKARQARNKPEILPKTKKPAKKELTKDEALDGLFTLTQIKKRYLKG